MKYTQNQPSALLFKRSVFLMLFLLPFIFLFPFFPIKKTKSTFADEKTVEKSNPYGWEKISAYTTYFSSKDGGRCENIAIAASLIDGVTLQGYGEFSFNATVGKRTEEAGFQQAKIILNGEYVLGVGGGVCQVSTTLYNAALKSGLEVTEFHPHSLPVAYVSPSRDAMVSTHSDLKLFNPTPNPVYLQAKTFDGGITVTFYGKKNGYRYEITSRTLGQISPPPPITKDGEEEGILREEKAGIKSESYLEIYQGKSLLSKKRLRLDEYRPVQGIIVKKILLPTKNIPSNDCLLNAKML